jgi:hypothetical protein
LSNPTLSCVNQKLTELMNEFFLWARDWAHEKIAPITRPLREWSDQTVKPIARRLRRWWRMLHAATPAGLSND